MIRRRLVVFDLDGPRGSATSAGLKSTRRPFIADPNSGLRGDSARESRANIPMLYTATCWSATPIFQPIKGDECCSKTCRIYYQFHNIKQKAAMTEICTSLVFKTRVATSRYQLLHRLPCSSWCVWDRCRKQGQLGNGV